MSGVDATGWFRRRIRPRRLRRARQALSGSPVAALRLRWLEACRELRGRGESRRSLEELVAVLLASLERHGVDVPSSSQRDCAGILGGNIVENPDADCRRWSVLLAAALATSLGQPVHMLVSSDRAVLRVRALLETPLSDLGITLGCIDASSSTGQRRTAYASDLIVSTPREAALDMLRQHIQQGATGRHESSGIAFPNHSARIASPFLEIAAARAIVDRADQFLIDESRIPVVIEAEERDAPGMEHLDEVFALAQRLRRGLHYERRDRDAAIFLYDAGLRELAASLPEQQAWPLEADLVRLQLECALRVLEYVEAGRDYQRNGSMIVVPGLLPGQGWLDQPALFWTRRCIECLEPGAVVVGDDVLARTTYRSLFQKYASLAGAAASVAGVERELSATYGVGLLLRRFAWARVATTRCELVADRGEMDDRLCAMMEGQGAGGGLLVVLPDAAERDRVLALAQSRGIGGVVAPTTAVSAETGAKTPRTAVVPLRDWLAVCDDQTLWPGMPVTLVVLGFPGSRRRLVELVASVRGAAPVVCYRQLMTRIGAFPGDPYQAPLLPGRLLQRRWLTALPGSLRLLYGWSLKRNESAERALRALSISRDTSINELLAFSGRTTL